MVGIYKLFPDTWMYKLGTRLRSFISGNICFEFSVQCRVVTNYFIMETAVERDGGGGVAELDPPYPLHHHPISQLIRVDLFKDDMCVTLRIGCLLYVCLYSVK